MLGNSLLNKLWNVITGCIVSRILCSIVVSSASWIQWGEGTDVFLSVELVDRSIVPLGGHDTVGVAARWRNCRLYTDCLMVSCSVIR